MKLIFPKFREFSVCCGAVLSCLILATTVAGFQTGYSGESTDPYFQRQSRPGSSRDADLSRVVGGTGANVENGWIQNSSNYASKEQSKASDNAPPKSIIRSTQDWNETHVIRNETFVPANSVPVPPVNSGPQLLVQTGKPTLTQSDHSAAVIPVIPPWRRELSSSGTKATHHDHKQQPEIKNDFLSASPPPADKESLDQSTSQSPDGFAPPSLPSRESPFQPAGNRQLTAPAKPLQQLNPIQSQPKGIPDSFPTGPRTARQTTNLESKSVEPGSVVNAIPSSFESNMDSPNGSGKENNSFEGEDFLPLSSKDEPSSEASRPPSKPILTEHDGNSQSAELQNQTATNESDNTSSFEPGRVLALVGGEPIFLADMLFDLNNFIKKVAPDAPESVVNQQRPLLIKKMLPRFIDSKLLYIGTIQGLPEQLDVEKILEQASEEFDEKALEKMMEQTGTKTTAEFDAHLRIMGSSLRKMRLTWGKEQLVRFFLSKQLNVDTEVTHQEMLDYYREHESDYLIQARAKWEQVMVRFDKFSSREKARNTIVELGDKIVYGAKLDAVAKESSHGFLASEGGQHDWTTRNALVLKELDKAIFELPIGALSDIIETRDGYHIVRVTDREDKTKKSFLDAQVEIKQKLEDQKREDAFREHLKKLKRDIPVEIFDFSEDEAPIGETYSLGK